MAWTRKSIFIGAHFWVVPVGAAFTIPGANNVTQDGTWPGLTEPNWPNWALGICESFDLDPKLGPSEVILNPNPGAVQAEDEIVPYAIPEIKFTLLQVDVLAIQLALNTQALFNTGVTQFNPNGGGGPGQRGIIKCQKYDQDNNLILNWQSWAFVKLASSLKGAPKTMTKPEFVATLLRSVNNTGAI